MEYRYPLQGIDIAGLIHIAVFDGEGGLIACVLHQVRNMEIIGSGGIGYKIHLFVQPLLNILFGIHQFIPQLVIGVEGASSVNGSPRRGGR